MPLVRAANNGISAAFDPHGRVLARLGLDVRGSIDTNVPAALALSLRADDPSATIPSLPPLSGTRVELVQVHRTRTGTPLASLGAALTSGSPAALAPISRYLNGSVGSPSAPAIAMCVPAT